MEQQKYNGWTNYETWNAALWMEESSDYYDESAQDAYDNAVGDDTFTRAERATLDLADALEQDFEENAPDLKSGPYADILNAAMQEINWYEIAAHYIEDVDKEEPETNAPESITDAGEIAVS